MNNFPKFNYANNVILNRWIERLKIESRGNLPLKILNDRLTYFKIALALRNHILTGQSWQDVTTIQWQTIAFDLDIQKYWKSSVLSSGTFKLNYQDNNSQSRTTAQMAR